VTVVVLIIIGLLIGYYLGYQRGRRDEGLSVVVKRLEPVVSNETDMHVRLGGCPHCGARDGTFPATVEQQDGMPVVVQVCRNCTREVVRG